MENIDFTEKAKLLRKAITENVSCEKTIIELTASFTKKERILIREAYEKETNRDLIADLESELSFNLKKTIIGLYRTSDEFYSHQIHLACNGMLIDKNAISEVIATKSNKEILKLKFTYQKIFRESLEMKLASVLSGYYKTLIMEILKSERNENESNEVDNDLVESDCISLYKAGEAKWGTDEEAFILIFSQRSSKHLLALNKLYKEKYKKDLIKIIDSEFSGDIRILLKTIMQYHLDPYIYYSKRIYKACKGFGTDDSTLIRVLITVSNNYSMKKLNEIFNNLYKMSLEYQITDETSGAYKQILLSLVKYDN
jgi:hypothetical protein